MSAHNLSADQLCDALTGERIRSVELGSPLESDQTTIAIHLAGSRSITISAVDGTEPDTFEGRAELCFETNRDGSQPVSFTMTDFVREHGESCEGCVECD